MLMGLELGLVCYKESCILMTLYHAMANTMPKNSNAMHDGKVWCNAVEYSD